MVLEVEAAEKRLRTLEGLDGSFEPCQLGLLKVILADEFVMRLDEKRFLGALFLLGFLFGIGRRL